MIKKSKLLSAVAIATASLPEQGLRPAVALCDRNIQARPIGSADLLPLQPTMPPQSFGLA